MGMMNAASETISIHALREEGDGGAEMRGGAKNISIHALREEGDSRCGHRCRCRS